MAEFEVAWLAHIGAPVPVLGPKLQAFYMQFVRRPNPHRPGPDMGRKIKELVVANLIEDEAGLLKLHARVLDAYRTIYTAVPRGHNRYLLKCIEFALADLGHILPEEQMIDNQ